MSFKQDLIRGKKAERSALEYIKRKYADAYIVDGYCKAWDIYIPSIGQGVEVKYDPMSKETGNIVIEVTFNNKPSALSTTKAYRWVFYTKEEMIITTPKRIKQLINKYNLSTVEFTGRGDYCSKKAYLMKLDMLKTNSILVNNHTFNEWR
tara:strand:+ start:902 stop:1351 length:450 start_codon:yes stop_codon:yes gene_type:complete